jgi:hypothetical protein
MTYQYQHALPVPKHMSLRDRVRGAALPQGNARVELVDVNNIAVDSYQREIRSYKLRRMIREWDPTIVGYVHLSLRADGSLFVIDGQHRIEAVRHLQGKLGPHIEAIVREGLTSQEEAHFFAESQNPKRRTALTPDDLHRASVYAGNTDAMDIERIVTATGFRIGNDRKGDGLTRVRATQALEDTYERYGSTHLFETLEFLGNAWGTKFAPQREMVSGAAMFLAMYPDANMTSLAKRVRKELHEDWRRRAKSRAQNDRLSSSEGVACLLHSDYNRANARKPLASFEDTLRDHKAGIRSMASSAAKRGRK